MNLPAALQDLAELAVQGVPLTQVARAADLLSGRYRTETQDGQWHVPDDLAARAYLLTRMPATYAAVSAAMRELREVLPDFHPRRLLDVGAGPGTALWATLNQWDSLQDAQCWEGSASMRYWGEQLSARATVNVQWQAVDVRRTLPTTSPAERADLVTLAYVLNELTLEHRETLIAELWQRTQHVLLIVEPGTPAGWQRMLQTRTQLLHLGAHVLAPCPHQQLCPVPPPDWCHFSQRVSRSKLHRQGKHADLSWEDEKFIYLAASKQPGSPVSARILSSPHARRGLIELKLCTAQGTLEHRTYSKRQGDTFKQVRKLDWGNALMPD